MTGSYSFLSCPPAPDYHARGRDWRERGGEQSSRVVGGGGGGGIHWDGSRGVTRTTMGDNPRTVPCDEALTANMAAHH